MCFLIQCKCQVHFKNKNGEKSTGCGRASCRKQHIGVKQQAQEWGVPGTGGSESLTPHICVCICIYMCAWALQRHEVWAPTQNSGNFWFKIWPDSRGLPGRRLDVAGCFWFWSLFWFLLPSWEQLLPRSSLMVTALCLTPCPAHRFLQHPFKSLLSLHGPFQGSAELPQFKTSCRMRPKTPR